MKLISRMGRLFSCAGSRGKDDLDSSTEGSYRVSPTPSEVDEMEQVLDLMQHRTISRSKKPKARENMQNGHISRSKRPMSQETKSQESMQHSTISRSKQVISQESEHSTITRSKNAQEISETVLPAEIAKLPTWYDFSPTDYQSKHDVVNLYGTLPRSHRKQTTPKQASPDVSIYGTLSRQRPVMKGWDPVLDPKNLCSFRNTITESPELQPTQLAKPVIPRPPRRRRHKLVRSNTTQCDPARELPSSRGFMPSSNSFSQPRDCDAPFLFSSPTSFPVKAPVFSNFYGDNLPQKVELNTNHIPTSGGEQIHRINRCQQQSDSSNLEKRSSYSSTSDNTDTWRPSSIISSRSSLCASSHSSQSSTSGQKKRVHILVNDPLHGMPGYHLREDAICRVSFNARTWDTMLQNFRVALEMNSVFICDGFLGNKCALEVTHELESMKHSGMFDQSMQASTTNPPFNYSTLFLHRAEVYHRRLDALVLMVYKLARHFTEEWDKISVGISYYPQGHSTQKVDLCHGDQLSRANSKNILKCVYFPHEVWDPFTYGGVYRVCTQPHPAVVDPTFDRLCAFWGDSLQHQVGLTAKEKFGIVIWLRKSAVS